MPTPDAATLESPYEPISYSTWSQTPEAQGVPDGLPRIQAYDDKLRTDLFERGLYNEDVENEIVQASVAQAARDGFLTQREDGSGLDTSPYESIKPRTPGTQFYEGELSRRDLGRTDALIADQARRGADEDEYAVLDRHIPQAERSELLTTAVRNGKLPFAVTEDGNLTVDANLGQLDNAAIVNLAKTIPGGIDPRYLPAIKEELTRLPGSNYTKAQARQASEFEKFVTDAARKDTGLLSDIERARKIYEQQGFSSDYKAALDSIERGFSLSDDDGYPPQVRRRLINDVIQKAAYPQGFDAEDPTKNVQYLSSGEVWLPPQLLVNKDLYDKTVNGLDVDPERKAQALAAREPRLAAAAPLFIDAMGADPKALEFYQEQKNAGKKDTEIIDTWFSDPKNYSSFKTRARAVGMAALDAVAGIPLGVAALAGDETSREALIDMQSKRAQNSKYAALSGDTYGIGQTVLNTAPQVVADILVTRGAGTLARAGIQGTARGLLQSAVRTGTRATANELVRSGSGSALRKTLTALGGDLGAKLGMGSGLFATTFARSAGSQYANVYSSLPDDMPPEEKRRVALGAATASGFATAAITLGFSALGAGGVEKLATGDLSVRALRSAYGMSDEAIATGIKSTIKNAMKGFADEAAEESSDQLVGDMIEALATGRDFNIGQTLKNAVEAGFVGGIFGGAGGVAESVAEQRAAAKTSTPEGDKLRDAGLPKMAAEVEKQQADAENPQKQALREALKKVTDELELEKTKPTETDGQKEMRKRNIQRLTAQQKRLEIAIRDSDSTIQLGMRPENAKQGAATGIEMESDTFEPDRTTRNADAEARPFAPAANFDAAARPFVPSSELSTNVRPSNAIEGNFEVVPGEPSPLGQATPRIEDTIDVDSTLMDTEAALAEGLPAGTPQGLPSPEQAAIGLPAPQQDTRGLPAPDQTVDGNFEVVPPAPAAQRTPQSRLLNTVDVESEVVPDRPAAVESEVVPDQAAPAAAPQSPDQAAVSNLAAGKYAAPAHRAIVEDHVQAGATPVLNDLKSALANTGFGGPNYANAVHKLIKAKIEERYPVKSYDSSTNKTVKSLGGGDLKQGGKLVSVPVVSDTHGAFTNDPFTTGMQLHVGLKVHADPSVALNPQIKAPRGIVTQVTMPDGQIVQGKGDYKRAGTATKAYESHRNMAGFALAVSKLPEADVTKSGHLPGGPDITPQTTEDDILSFYLDIRGDAPSTLGRRVRKAVSEVRALEASDADSIEHAVVQAFLRDMREWSLANSETIDADLKKLSSDDFKAFGFKGAKEYKAYLLNRKETVWDGILNGRFATPDAFIKPEIANTVAGKGRRAKTESVQDTDEETGESKLERAAARNTFEPDTSYKEAVGPGFFELAEAGNVEPNDLVELVKSRPEIEQAFRKALREMSAFAPNTTQAIEYAARVKAMDHEDLVMSVAATVLNRPEVAARVKGTLQRFGKQEPAANQVVSEKAEEHLTPAEKAEAAKELGDARWTEQTAVKFAKRMADWVVNAASVSAKLGKIFSDFAKKAGKGLAILVAAVSLTPITVPSKAEAISPAAVYNEFKQIEIASAQPMTPDPVSGTATPNPEAGPAPAMSGTGDMAIASAPLPEASEISLPVLEPDFKGADIDAETRVMARWVVAKKDNAGKPFVIASKTNGAIAFFNANGELIHNSPALYGKAIGDVDSGMNIDDVRSNAATAGITPAGRFDAKFAYSSDYGDVLHLAESGDAVIAIHKVFTKRPEENRPGRLASPTAGDNRISLGCINVSEEAISEALPAFRNDGGIVYVMPETPEGRSIFAGFQGLPQEQVPQYASVEPGLFKSMSYGVNQMTDQQIAQARIDNTLVATQLGLANSTFTQVLERIARSPQYPRRYRAVAKLALESGLPFNLSLVDAPVEAYAGLYSGSTRTVTLNMASTNGRGLLDVLSHELLHGLTVSIIDNPVTAKAKAFRDKLDKLRGIVDEAAPAHYKYATSDLHEFLTHTLTDPGFQSFVQQVKSGTRSVWQRIVDAVTSFFGKDLNASFVEDLFNFVKMGSAHAAMYGYSPKTAASRQASGVVPSPSISRVAPTNDTADNFALLDTLLADALPPGYEYAELNEPNRVAASVPSQPGVILINKELMARVTEGLDAANAKALVRKWVNHEAAHHEVFATFTPEEIADIAANLNTGTLLDMAASYYQGAGYDADQALEALQADIAAGNITPEIIVEEFLRAQLESATSGKTTEQALLFYRTNPNMLQRVLSYLGDVLKKLWARTQGVEDIHMRVAISRLMREHRRIQQGFMPSPANRFDSNDPLRDNRRFASLAVEDPKASPIGPVLESLKPTLADNRTPFKETKWWQKLFQYRTGDSRPVEIARERAATLEASTNLIEKAFKQFEKAIAAESPDIAVVNAAAGSTDPYISDAQRAVIQEQFDAEMAWADEQPASEWKAAAEQAAKNKKEMEMQARIDTAQAARDAQNQAFEILDKEAPKTAAAIRYYRDIIDKLSSQLAEWMPPGVLQTVVGELGQGIYLTRTYNIHHKDGDPLGVTKDPELAEARIAAETFFENQFVETRAREIQIERAEYDEKIGLDDAKALARAEAAEDGVGRAMLEDYLLSHGSKAFFHGGTNFRVDLTRYMTRGDVPEVLRTILEEETDPLSNLTRTAFNVSMLAANTRFVNEQARIGAQAGYLITEVQKQGYRKMIQIPNEEKFIQEAINQGYAKAAPQDWLTEVQPGVYLPTWLTEAYAARDLTKFDQHRKIATTGLKYGAGRLDGLYAAPVLADWFEHEFTNPPVSKVEDEKWLRKAGNLVGQATGLSMGIVTLGSVGFYARNAASTAFFLMNQGINPLAKETIKATKPALNALMKNPDAELTELTALGVVGDDLRPATLKELLRSLSDQPGNEGNWLNTVAKKLHAEKGLAKTKEGLGKLADTASAIDSYAKIVAYYYELGILQKARGSKDPASDEETRRMKNEAARKVRSTFQARSQTPPIIESLTKSSFGQLLAPFLRFKSDVFRIQINTWREGLAEIKSGNPVLVRRGYQRLAGWGSVMAVATAVPILVNAMSGVGDDEEQALRSALPKYLRGNSIIYFDPNPKDKTISSLDLTYVNPFSFTWDPVRRVADSLVRGEPGQSTEELAKWFASGFLEEQIAAGAVLEVKMNQDADGKKIWNETDDVGTKFTKATSHLIGSAYTPQSVKVAGKVVKASTNGVSESAGFYDTPVGLALGHALPVRPRSHNLDDLAFRSFREQAQIGREIRMGAGRLKTRQILDQDDVDDITGDWYNGMASLYEDVGTRVRGFEGLGLSKAEVAKQMTEGGFSQDRSRSIVFSGKATTPALTPAMKRDILGQGEKAKGGGGAKRLEMVQQSLRRKPRVFEVDVPRD